MWSTNDGVIFTGSTPHPESSPGVSTAEPQHFDNTVAVMQFVKQRSDDVVQARTQTTTRDDRGARLFRIEKQLRPRPRQLELDSWIGADLDALRNASGVAGRVTFRGGEARFAECGRVHRKTKIA